MRFLNVVLVIFVGFCSLFATAANAVTLEAISAQEALLFDKQQELYALDMSYAEINGQLSNDIRDIVSAYDSLMQNCGGGYYGTGPMTTMDAQAIEECKEGLRQERDAIIEELEYYVDGELFDIAFKIIDLEIVISDLNAVIADMWLEYNGQSEA